jgi:hypothetical protein
MSELSANTYSWAGEGSLSGGGGDSFGVTAAFFGSTLEKNLRIPSFCCSCRLLSSSDGTEERPEESVSDIVALLRGCCKSFQESTLEGEMRLKCRM